MQAWIFVLLKNLNNDPMRSTGKELNILLFNILAIAFPKFWKNLHL